MPVNISYTDGDQCSFSDSPILKSIYTRIVKIYNIKSDNGLYRDELEQLNGLVDSIKAKLPSLVGFKEFLDHIHDVMITGDSNLRTLILRIIKISVESGRDYATCFLNDQDFVWEVCSSYEKDTDFLPERVTALKIIYIFASAHADIFPAPFIRSLVAIAFCKDDTLRRVSLESLRLLCLNNPIAFSRGNCVVVMMEAILDPNLSDLSKSLLLSLLHVLSDDKFRRYLSPKLDLRILLSPFMEFDHDASSDRSASLLAAKSALVTSMRTWTGLILLTSDSLGLPVLCKLLQDPKTSPEVLDVVVDAFVELFKPVISTLARPKRSYNPSDLYGGTATGNMLPLSRRSSGGDLPRAMSTTLLSNYLSTEATRAVEAPVKRVSLTVEDVDIKSRSLSIDSNRIGAKKNPVSRTINQPYDSKGKKTGFLSLFSLPNRGATKKRASAYLEGTSTISSISESPSLLDLERESDIMRASDNRLTFLVDTNENTPDPVYNLLDNYCALLCCSIIHAKLIESLCYLATHAYIELATKSRDLLVDILKTISMLFPEGNCSDLLGMPFLIEFASSVSTAKLCSRAEKSSMVLSALSDAFATVSIEKLRTKTANSDDRLSNIQDAFLDDSLQHESLRLHRLGGEQTLSRRLESSVPSRYFRNNGSGRLNDGSSPSSLMTTIFLMADEVKRTSQSRVMSFADSNPINSSNSSKVITDLRVALISAIDKGDFNKQMENSKVLSKDGKEPLKWEWTTISDMLEFSFQHSDRLAEALKTKWVRRLSGFYRCTNDEKAYFANMDWDISNLHYLECACNLYHILVEDENGMSFLSSDRRGIVFADISKEIELLLELSNKATVPNGVRNVFRAYNCRYTMTREYFTLLGRLTTTSQGRKVLDDNKVFQNMSSLGSNQSLDYISRLAVTSLAFTDHGFLSRHILQLWACGSTCNPDFRSYMYNLLLVVLLSRPQDFMDWGVDVLVSCLSNEDDDPILFKIVHIASEDKNLLKQLILRKCPINDEPQYRPVLTRLACIPEGISYLKSKDLLERQLDYFADTGLKEYALEIDRRVGLGFFHIDGGLKGGSHLNISTAIPVFVNSFASFSAPYQQLNPTVDDKLSTSRKSSNVGVGVSSISSGLGQVAAALSAHNLMPSESMDVNAAAVDLEGLIRLPWNVEAKTYTSSANNEYLKIDSFLDISDLKQPIDSDVVSDWNRFIKVRGILVDGKGNPQPTAIPINRTLSTTLLIGMSSVHRNGTVFQPNETRSLRRKSITITPVAPTSNPSGRDSSGRRSSATSPAPEDNDIPVISIGDEMYDWSHCKPTDRYGNKMIDMGDGLYYIDVANEPVRFIFSKFPSNSTNLPPSTSVSQRRKSDTIVGRSSTADSTPINSTPNRYTGGYIYLKEIQYFLRLETRQALYIPMPRHLYGELSKSIEGISLLKNNDIISELIVKARLESNSVADRTAALWGLGHIGSSDIGLVSILHQDSAFIDWIAENAVENGNISLRGVFYAILGLIGRSKKGAKMLYQLQWNTTPLGSANAVAIPRDIRMLFGSEDFSLEIDRPTVFTASTDILSRLSPFFMSGSTSLEIEVLNLIAKLPGIVPINKESKARLLNIKSHHSDLFRSRQLFMTVRDLLSNYSFSLELRRWVVKLFDVEAKLKGQLK